MTRPSGIPARPTACLVALVSAALLAACGDTRSASDAARDSARADSARIDSARSDSAGADSAFAAVQSRGQGVMGVDQYTSQHVFESLPDGGRIVLDRDDGADSASIATIRAHMREVAADFRVGSFAKPFQVHAQVVPGTDVMGARRERIRYEVVDRPRGAEVRIVTNDAEAVAAVHRFLEFQRSDHRAAGHEGHEGHEGHGGGGHQP